MTLYNYRDIVLFFYRYMDGTFKVINKPFTQLYSIHLFVKQNGEIKQVPLVFALMPGKSKCDYWRVLMAIRNLLPEQIVVQCVVADFEAALWKAVENALPDELLQGCAFCLCRKITILQ